MSNIQEIKVRSILSQSKLPGVDFVINPYRGCQHACVYCYACFMQKFDGHSEPWGTYVDVKSNALEILTRQLAKCHNRTVYLSSVCDPYQPVEAEYQLTRQILKQLIIAQPQLTVQTKSALVIRDLDLLEKFKTVREASLKTHHKRCHIAKWRKSGLPNSYKHIWKFISEEEFNNL